MKQIEIDNNELQSIVVEALSNTQPCFKDKKCNIEESWVVLSPPQNNKRKIVIKSDIWSTLENYIKRKPLDYRKALRLTICIGEQLTALNESGYGFTHITPKDIMVIDENWYLITNLDNAMPLEKEDNIKIMKPLTKSIFLAPELKTITKLPALVNQSCGLYSIATLVLHSLGLENTQSDRCKLMPSSLFYLLERCCVDTPSERTFLLL
tara:strand:- start:1075 stop:1701 length:627 start_codon:yes stop_codon:yes gene_type:complete